MHDKRLVIDMHNWTHISYDGSGQMPAIRITANQFYVTAVCMLAGRHRKSYEPLPNVGRAGGPRTDSILKAKLRATIVLYNILFWPSNNNET